MIGRLRHAIGGGAARVTSRSRAVLELALSDTEAYALGLEWHEAVDDVAAIRRAQRRAGWTLVATCNLGDRILLGFADDRLRPGTISLAAHLLRRVDGNLLICTDLEIAGRRSWWLIGIRDGTLLIDTDVVLPTEATAREAVSELLGLGGWEVLQLPSEWNAPNAQPVDLGGLLSREVSTGGRRIDPQLKRMVDPKLSLFAALMFVAGSMLAGVALWTGRSVSPEPPEPLVASTPEDAATEREPPPWERVPPPAPWLQACRQGMVDMAVAVPGWTLERIACDGNRVEATWQAPEAGHWSWLRAALLERDVDGELLEQGRQGRATASVPLLDPRGFEGLWARGDVAAQFWDTFGALGISVDLAEERTAAALPGEPPRPVHRGFRFQFVTPLSPDGWEALLAVPATVLDEIAYEPPTGVWRVIGTVFHR